jgi:hypothetical protein
MPWRTWWYKSKKNIPVRGLGDWPWTRFDRMIHHALLLWQYVLPAPRSTLPCPGAFPPQQYRCSVCSDESLCSSGVMSLLCARGLWLKYHRLNWSFISEHTHSKTHHLDLRITNLLWLHRQSNHYPAMAYEPTKKLRNRSISETYSKAH